LANVAFANLSGTNEPNGWEKGSVSQKLFKYGSF